MPNKISIFLFASFLLFSVSFKAQFNPTQLYNEGVLCYNKQEMEKADSLFTVALSMEINKDTYFSRGLCRGKMANKIGYCADMAYASYLGEEKATKLFCKGGGRIDTVYTLVENKATPAIIYARTLNYNFGDSSQIKFVTKYYKQAANPNYIKQKKDTAKGPEVFTLIEEMAEFPGGLTALMGFIKKHIIVPKKLNVNGKVFVKFVVNEDGSISNIDILKEIPNCPECNEEATRLVAIMPYWKSAKMKGSDVKCYFNLPISFRLD